MSYKIAVASSDGTYVNSHFGSASSFIIIEVNDDGTYNDAGEIRVPDLSGAQAGTPAGATSGIQADIQPGTQGSGLSGTSLATGSNCGIKKSIVGEVYECRSKNKGQAEGCESAGHGGGCGSKSGCDPDTATKHGGGCGSGHSDTAIDARAEAIADCRCLLCKKIGPGAERQLERKAITTFQIDLKIDEALAKITSYYSKLDNHISLRRC